MKKRLIALLFVVILSTTTLTLFPLKASAWTGNLPTCSLPSTSWDWQTSLQTKYNTYVTNQASQSVKLKNSMDDSSYIVYKATGTGTHWIVAFKGYLTTEPDNYYLSFVNDPSSSTQSYLYVPGTTSIGHYWELDFTNSNANNEGGWGFDSMSATGAYAQGVFWDNLQCVVSVHNVSYDTSYTGITYPGYSIQSGTTTTTSCAITDFSCNLNKLQDGIVNGVQNLFVPSDTYFSTTINSQKIFYEQKLGILLYPIEFIPDLFDAFHPDCTGTATYGCDYSSASLGNFFGHNVTLSTEMPATLSQYIDVIRPILQMITLVGLISLVWHKYKKLVHRNDS